jgi:hypothetical protein
LSEDALVEAIGNLWDSCEKEYIRRYGKTVNVDVVCKWFERADHHIISNKIQAEKSKKTGEPATQRQIDYAESLGIVTPEKYSKQDLAALIDEARNIRG